MGKFDDVKAQCLANSGKRCVLRTTASAGLMIRGQFRRAVKEYCFINSLELDLQEDKGFFESVFMIKVTGESEVCSNFGSRRPRSNNQRKVTERNHVRISFKS